MLYNQINNHYKVMGIIGLAQIPMGSVSPFFKLYTSVIMFPLPSSLIFLTSRVPLGYSYYSVVVVIGMPFSTTLFVVTDFFVYTPLSTVYTVDVLTASPLFISRQLSESSIKRSKVLLHFFLRIGLKNYYSLGISNTLFYQKS